MKTLGVDCHQTKIKNMSLSIGQSIKHFRGSAPARGAAIRDNSEWRIADPFTVNQ